MCSFHMQMWGNSGDQFGGAGAGGGGLFAHDGNTENKNLIARPTPL